MHAEQIATKPSVRMELSAAEAEWLQAYLQNPHSDDEAAIDRQMRELFFNELRDLSLGWF
mgnify:FL=1